MFEIPKSGDKTSSGEIGLNIRIKRELQNEKFLPTAGVSRFLHVDWRFTELLGILL